MTTPDPLDRSVAIGRMPDGSTFEIPVGVEDVMPAEWRMRLK